jgi:hypothetical protein
VCRILPECGTSGRHTALPWGLRRTRSAALHAYQIRRHLVLSYLLPCREPQGYPQSGRLSSCFSPGCCCASLGTSATRIRLNDHAGACANNKCCPYDRLVSSLIRPLNLHSPHVSYLPLRMRPLGIRSSGLIELMRLRPFGYCRISHHAQSRANILLATPRTSNSRIVRSTISIASSR